METEEKPTEATIGEEPKHETAFIKNMNYMILDTIAVTGITIKENVNREGLTEIPYSEFREMFLVKEGDGSLYPQYIHKDYQNIKFRKNIIDTKLKLLIQLLSAEGKVSKNVLHNWLKDINVFFKTDEPYPIVFCISVSSKEVAFIVAPISED